MIPPSEPSFSVAEIAEICGGRLSASEETASRIVRCVAAIEDASEDSVTWLAEEKHAAALSNCRAAAVIGANATVGSSGRGIVVPDPELAIAQVLERFHIPIEPPEPGVHPTAVVHGTARLGDDVAVGAHAAIGARTTIGSRTACHAGVSIGSDVRIGEDCVLHDRCVIYDRCEIGNNVIVHSGTVIGADGFGYIFREGRHRRLMHLGTVVVEDDVEIGANTCVDRGKLGATRIGRGTKIDDLVMIAHNVQIGPLCIITGQVGLGGSARLGAGVIMGGGSGVIHGRTVGDNSRLGARSLLVGDLPPGSVVSGTPARPHMEEYRNIVRLKKLPRIRERIAALERRVAELEGPADH